MIDNFEALIKGINGAVVSVGAGDNDEAYESIRALEDAKDTPQNVQKSLKDARTALDREDMNVYDTKMDLSLERAKFWMDKTTNVAASLLY